MTCIPAVPDPPELDFVLWEGFSPSDVSYDVGANCGQTLRRIRQFSKKVAAFEPAEESFNYLINHYALDSSIFLFSWAVSDHSGEVDLVSIPEKIRTGQLVTSGPAQMEWSDDVASGEIRTLHSITLDDFAFDLFEPPHFIKIDVEGHEAHVLRGAEKILKDIRPELLIEIHSEDLGQEIEDLLQGTYHIELVRHPHYPGGSDLWKAHYWYRCFPYSRRKRSNFLGRYSEE